MEVHEFMTQQNKISPGLRSTGFHHCLSSDPVWLGHSGWCPGSMGTRPGSALQSVWTCWDLLSGSHQQLLGLLARMMRPSPLSALCHFSHCPLPLIHRNRWSVSCHRRTIQYLLFLSGFFTQHFPVDRYMGGNYCVERSHIIYGLIVCRVQRPEISPE